MANGCAFGSCIIMIGAFLFLKLLPDGFPNLEQHENFDVRDVIPLALGDTANLA